MVYVIAAYTITIGTLAIYGILMRHRQHVAMASLARLGGIDGVGRSALDSLKGFNVGAALLPPLWMWAHGLRVPGAVLLVISLSIIPLMLLGYWIPSLAAAAIPIAAGAALGFSGNQIAMKNLEIEDAAVLAARQLPWALAGIVLHVIVLPWCYFLFVLNN